MKPPRTSLGDPADYLEQRVYRALGAFSVVSALGSLGYYYLGQGQWAFWDCLYMTMVTVSTVGFSETLPGIEHVEGARAFTVLLILMGSGVLLYSASTVTAFVVEGDLVGILRRNRMQQKIDNLNGHIVVCGAGSTGSHVIEELHAMRAPFVVVDANEDRLRELDREHKDYEVPYVVGDATDDDVLIQAGIERAKGVIAALTNDKDNLFVTISARALNVKARIVAKSVEVSSDAKMRRAGANAIVSPNRIGGLRLASEMIRPRATEFIDVMLRDPDHLRIAELEIPSDSGLVGLELRETAIRRDTDVLVIALKERGGNYTYNPKPTARLETGMTLIVMANPEDLANLERGMRDGTLARLVN